MPNFFNYRFVLISFLTCFIFFGMTGKSSAQNLSVYPGSGARGTNLTVTISSSNVTFHQGSSTVCPNKINVYTSNVVFQQGSSTLYPSNITTSNGVIQATINIPSNTSTGYYDVSVGQDGSCPVSLSSGFQVINPSLEIYPSSANVGTTLTVNISGTSVDFHQGSPTVCPNKLNVSTSNVVLQQGSSTIYPSSITTNNGVIQATVNIPSNAFTGYYDVLVGQGESCQTNLNSGFKVTAPISPGISLYPSSADKGTLLTVNIYGTGVDFHQGSPTVCPNKLNVSTSNIVFKQSSSTINNTIYPSSISTNNGVIQATISVPSNASTGYYDVIVGQGESCPVSLYSGFSVTPTTNPQINLYPSSVNSGSTITVSISGTGVNFHQGSPTVCPSQLNVNTSNVTFRQGSSTIYPTAVTVSNGLILAQISIPSSANGYYNVTVGEGSNCSVSKYNGLYVTPTQPALTVSPNNANYGQTLNVTIAGTGVNFHQGSPTVCPAQLNVNTSNVFFRRGSSTIYPNSISTTNGLLTAQITIPTNVAPGAYDLIVGNGAECTISKSNALIISNPYITTSISNSAITGKSLDITISGHGINFTQSSSTLCPGLLNVSTSNVVFKQGSSIIYPSSISISNDHIVATLDIPENATAGFYYTIVGYNEECSYDSYNSFYVQKPSISVSPSTGRPNQLLSVSISGVGINFHQGSATVCPSNLNVTSSDIVFRSGSLDIHPSSISIIEGAIVANLDIPSNAPLGNYEVIIGENSDCSISQPYAFTVANPTIYAYSYITDENIRTIMIQGNGLTFTQESSTSCPDLININNTDIYITDGMGVATIYPISINLVNSTTVQCSFNLSSNMDLHQFIAVIGNETSCLYTSQIYDIVLGSSTSQPVAESITKIYPNPSDGKQVNLDISKQGTFEITVINPYGQSIGTTTVNGPGNITLPEILTERLTPGMYMININDGKKIQHEKFIVQ